MKEKKVRAVDILRMIPYEELAKLSLSTKVDYCAKVLSGERVFYLLVYALLAADEVSQRKLETVFGSEVFKRLFNISLEAKVTHGSISSRLSKINAEFFEKAYELVYGRFSEMYAREEALPLNLIWVDSTMVAETSGRLKRGFTVGKKPGGGKAPRRQIKYTMGYDGFSARLTEVFSDSRYLSEDVAMPEVVTRLIRRDAGHENLYVLDRGFSSPENYERVTEQRGRFVGRIKTNRRMETVRRLTDGAAGADLGDLELTDDVAVHLYDSERRAFSETEYRVIRARFKAPRDTSRRSGRGKARRAENEIHLITNDFGLTAGQIAEAYRRRWDIEVFFKFLKQNLSFSHFVSTSENGIRVILYMTLITAMLVMIYKRENGMGYTIGKFSFYLEMQDWVVNLMATLKNDELNLLAYEDIKLRAGVS